MILLLAFIALAQLYTIKEVLHMMVHIHYLEDWADEHDDHTHFMRQDDEEETI